MTNFEAQEGVVEVLTEAIQKRLVVMPDPDKEAYYEPGTKRLLAPEELYGENTVFLTNLGDLKPYLLASIAFVTAANSSFAQAKLAKRDKVETLTPQDLEVEAIRLAKLEAENYYQQAFQEWRRPGSNISTVGLAFFENHDDGFIFFNMIFGSKENETPGHVQKVA